MQWHTVVIDSGDQFAKDSDANAFMNKFDKTHREYVSRIDGIPEGFEVWHKRDAQGNHIYQFSPIASSIGEDLLRPRSATACDVKPNLTGYAEIKL